MRQRRVSKGEAMQRIAHALGTPEAIAAMLVFKWTPDRNGVGTLTAMRGDKTLAVEKMNILKSKARDDFRDRLVLDFPDTDSAEVDEKLMEIATDAADDGVPDEPSASFDVSAICRPELFHVTEVSGVAIPQTRLILGKPAGSWSLYLRWHADGRREVRDLEPALDLPNGRLWFHPQPVAPEPTARAGWSDGSRKTWLAGGVAPDPVDVARRLCKRFAHFLEFPPDSCGGTIATLALWTMLTYVYTAWSAVPYIAFGGPLASGKSTAFHVLSRVVFRPLETSNMTAPCLFRTLHERGGVLLLDEAERLRDGTPDAGEIRSVLLSGYKRGSPAMRLEKVGDGFRRTEFDVFGPKALACIATLPEALASRCIRVSMFRAGPESPKPRRRIDQQPELWAALRDDLHVLSLEHGREWLALAGRADVVPAKLGGRDFELWQPILALAAWLDARGADGLLALIQAHATAAAEQCRNDAVPETDEILLRILAAHVIAGTNVRLKAGGVLNEARESDKVTFDRWTAKGVGDAIGRYGLKTRQGTGNTGRVYRHVTISNLRRVETAYGFDLGLPPADVSQCIASVATCRGNNADS